MLKKLKSIFGLGPEAQLKAQKKIVASVDIFEDEYKALSDE